MFCFEELCKIRNRPKYTPLILHSLPDAKTSKRPFKSVLNMKCYLFLIQNSTVFPSTDKMFEYDC